MPGSDLVPFTDVTIANLRLEKIKNRKLQNAIAAASTDLRSKPLRLVWYTGSRITARLNRAKVPEVQTITK